MLQFAVIGIAGIRRVHDICILLVTQQPSTLASLCIAILNCPQHDLAAAPFARFPWAVLIVLTCKMLLLVINLKIVSIPALGPVTYQS